MFCFTLFVESRSLSSGEGKNRIGVFVAFGGSGRAQVIRILRKDAGVRPDGSRRTAKI